MLPTFRGPQVALNLHHKKNNLELKTSGPLRMIALIEASTNAEESMYRISTIMLSSLKLQTAPSPKYHRFGIKLQYHSWCTGTELSVQLQIPVFPCCFQEWQQRNNDAGAEAISSGLVGAFIWTSQVYKNKFAIVSN